MSWLTVEDVAQKLKVTPETIRRYIRRGELEAVKVGRVLRVAPEALDRFLAKLAKPAPQKRPVMGVLHHKGEAKPAGVLPLEAALTPELARELADAAAPAVAYLRRDPRGWLLYLRHPGKDRGQLVGRLGLDAVERKTNRGFVTCPWPAFVEHVRQEARPFELLVEAQGRPLQRERYATLGEALAAAKDACRIPRVFRAEVLRRGQLLAAWGWLPGHRIPRWGRLTPPLAGGFSPK